MISSFSPGYRVSQGGSIAFALSVASRRHLLSVTVPIEPPCILRAPPQCLSVGLSFRPKIDPGSIYHLQCLTAGLFTVIYFYLPIGVLIGLFAPRLIYFQSIHLIPRFLPLLQFNNYSGAIGIYFINCIGPCPKGIQFACLFIM